MAPPRKSYAAIAGSSPAPLGVSATLCKRVQSLKDLTGSLALESLVDEYKSGRPVDLELWGSKILDEFEERDKVIKSLQSEKDEATCRRSYIRYVTSYLDSFSLLTFTPGFTWSKMLEGMRTEKHTAKTILRTRGRADRSPKAIFREASRLPAHIEMIRLCKLQKIPPEEFELLLTFREDRNEACHDKGPDSWKTKSVARTGLTALKAGLLALPVSMVRFRAALTFAIDTWSKTMWNRFT